MESLQEAELNCHLSRKKAATPGVAGVALAEQARVAAEFEGSYMIITQEIQERD
jgi:hypothetical protein